MASHGIRDQVAVVGMGCTPFGELWGKSTSDLIVDAATACLTSAGLTQDAIDAYWLGTMDSGYSGLTLSLALKTDYKPVTRVENMCATGSEAFRNACYAVAAGAYDVAMVLGVEKLKDSGYSGLVRQDPPDDGTAPETTAPAAFSYLAPAYQDAYGVDDDTMREVLTRIAVKNHDNGSRNPLAQFRKAVSAETVSCAPLVAGQLGVFDCSGVADGAAAAIVVRAEDAQRYDSAMYVKALSMVAGRGDGMFDDQVSLVSFPEVIRCAADAYAQAGIVNPREEVSFAEVHDCFTPTELVLMEDLGFSDRGMAWKDVLEGDFEMAGRLPINVDGGLKSFGHPIGATGLRMLYECWLQLRGQAGARQLNEPRIAMTQNLGGRPGRCVSFISLVGRDAA